MIRAAVPSGLTPPRRLWQAGSTERRNSPSSGIRTRQTCGFFVPDVFVGRAAVIQQRLGAKAARRLLAVSTLPTPTGAVHSIISPWSPDPSGDINMHLLPRVPAARSRASSDTRETLALTLAADYRSADAARDSYDAKFQMLEDAGIDVVTLLERIERGSVTSAAEGSA